MSFGKTRSLVGAMKIALGEWGPVWWIDGAPDLDRHMARTAVHADWFASIEREGRGRPSLRTSPEVSADPFRRGHAATPGTGERLAGALVSPRTAAPTFGKPPQDAHSRPGNTRPRSVRSYSGLNVGYRRVRVCLPGRRHDPVC